LHHTGQTHEHELTRFDDDEFFTLSNPHHGRFVEPAYMHMQGQIKGLSLHGDYLMEIQPTPEELKILISRHIASEPLAALKLLAEMLMVSINKKLE
jgi:hypothetical protein